MLTGYNHNIKYSGHIFHVQTEDCTLDKPDIATHLFAGGQIINSLRTNGLTPKTKKLMATAKRKKILQTQHRDMCKLLLSGALDEALQKASLS